MHEYLIFTHLAKVIINSHYAIDGIATEAREKAYIAKAAPTQQAKLQAALQPSKNADALAKSKTHHPTPHGWSVTSQTI